MGNPREVIRNKKITVLVENVNSKIQISHRFQEKLYIPTKTD